MFNVAIDGPAGAGKSTIAKKVAKELDFIYVDTGAMYRSMALYFIRKQVKAAEVDKIITLLPEIHVTIAYENGEQHVYLNGEDVSTLIRNEEVSQMTSSISTIPEVREKLLSLQRNLAKENNVLMDGRDIGTCVLPDAELKIYLTASVEVRAKRRYNEMIEKGMECDLEELEASIKERDYRDMNREIAPLKQAEDAVLLDTSDMNIEEVVNAIIQMVKERA
ncbi:MAG: (d)CMP kinase [Lachnospiraceae bacterium]|nr:(d)CMP kinase [Lachnospiraceae bacterium]